MNDTREDLEARIAAYIDGELPPADAARLEVFLANTDPQLAEQIIAMLGDRHNLRALPKPNAPPDLSARIMEQIERATLLNDIPHHEHQPRPWWHSRAAIAAGFILLIGGFSFFVAESVIGPKEDKHNHPLADSHSAQTTAPAATGTSIALGPSGPSGPSPASPLPAVEPHALAAAKGGPSPGDINIASAGSLAKAIDSSDKTLPALPLLPGDAAATQFDNPENKELAQAEKNELGLQTQLARNSDVLRSNQASAAKMGYAAVESPARALANISAGNSNLAPEPIIITLVAHDEHDFARLHAALETIMIQDPATAHRQIALQNRYLNVLSNGGSYFGNATRTTNNFAGNIVLNNSISNTSNNINNGISNNAGNNSVSNSGTNPGNGSGGTLRLDNAKKDADAAASKSAIVTTSTPAPAVTPSAVADAVDSLANNNAANNAVRYQIYSPKQRDFADVPPAATQPAFKAEDFVTAGGTVTTTQPAAGKQAAHEPDVAGDHPASPPALKSLPAEQKQLAPTDHSQGQAAQIQTQNQTNTPANRQYYNGGRRANAELPAIPFYRVALRPEQLEQLAQEFHVDSITSGRQAYVITPESYNHPRDNEDLAQSETQTTEKSKDQPAKTITKAEASAATHAKDDQSQAGQKLADEKIAAANSAPAQAPPIYRFDASKDGPWLECIITMEPRPAAPASPADQRQTK